MDFDIVCLYAPFRGEKRSTVGSRNSLSELHIKTLFAAEQLSEFGDFSASILAYLFFIIEPFIKYQACELPSASNYYSIYFSIC